MFQTETLSKLKSGYSPKIQIFLEICGQKNRKIPQKKLLLKLPFITKSLLGRSECKKSSKFFACGRQFWFKNLQSYP